MRVLITGAAAGLAAGIAVRLAGSGHEVVLTYRPGGTPPDSTLQAIAAAGGRARAAPVLFGDDDDAVTAQLRAAADPPPEVLVHAVGPMIVRRFERCTMAEYHEMIDGNFRSAVLAAQVVLPAMRAAGFGRLIFFGMNGSEVTRPARGLSLHLAAKAAVVAFAKTLALEEGRYGITVNAVEPGDIRRKTLSREDALHETAANPRGRPGTAADVAGAVAFLADPQNDFINGAVIAVTGGLIEPYERNASPP